MIPGRDRRRLRAESILMRLIATGGIVAVGVALGAILVSQAFRAGSSASSWRSSA